MVLIKFSVIFLPFLSSVSETIVSILDFFSPVILKSDRVGSSVISIWIEASPSSILVR